MRLIGLSAAIKRRRGGQEEEVGLQPVRQSLQGDRQVAGFPEPQSENKTKQNKATEVTDTQADRPSRVASSSHVHGFGVWEDAGVAGETPPTQTQGVCVNASGWKQLIKTKKNTSVEGRPASFVLKVTRYLFIYSFFKNNAAVANWFGIFRNPVDALTEFFFLLRGCALN